MGTMLPPEPSKVQQFQFQTSGILLSMSVQKLHGPEIPRFLRFILQFLDNSTRLSIFYNYIKKIRSLHVELSEKVWYLTLDLQKSFSLWNRPKKDHNEQDF